MGVKKPVGFSMGQNSSSKSFKRRAHRQPPVAEAVEPRLLFSADLGAAALLAQPTGSTVNPVALIQTQSDANPVSLSTQSQYQAYVVDMRINNAQTVLQGIQHLQDAALARSERFEILTIDANEDGVAKISRYLSDKTGITGLHIVSHGSDSMMLLGNSWLDEGALRSRALEFASWGTALSREGDILLYGCDFAASQSGQSAVKSLAQLTGADVAANSQNTGTATIDKPADWTLDYQQGIINTEVLLGDEIAAVWQGQLNTFVVINTNSSGAGSLAQAVLDAQANLGADTISFNVVGAGPQTINLVSGLVFTDQITLDGTTQGGYSGTPLIVLNGVGAGAGQVGIQISANNSIVRGLTIQNFQSDGIRVAASNVTIRGNWIGLNAAGSASAGNGGAGISLTSGSNLTIGGLAVNEGNVISGNVLQGISIAAGSGHVIEGNFIGTAADGITVISNASAGIAISTGSNASSRVGGVSAASRNVIANQTGLAGSGVSVSGNTTGVAIIGNSIYSNDARGINLNGSSTPATNDSLDGDGGNNQGQNYPVLSSANSFGGDTTIVGTFNSTANTAFRIEYFSSNVADASDHGGGKTYLGSASVTTDGLGNISVTTLLSGVTVAAGRFVSATATVDLGAGSFGNTSEFSSNVIATANAPSIIVTPVSGLTTTEAGGTATFSIVLTTAPLSSVTINLSSSNTAEGTVSVSSVTFTSANWNVAQVVTVSGVADALVDGNIAYSIVTANAVSADAAYSGLVVADVSVTNLDNTGPSISSNGGLATASISVAENATAVTTVTATDADLPAQTLTYSIGGGADAAKFSINASTGVLVFTIAQNFESPTDMGGNNVYDVIVRVSDGYLTSQQAIAVTVTPVNEFAPVITSNGGLATASINVAENSTAVTTVTATDADLPGATLTYSISGGADAARFSINAATGVLVFAAAPNFESPTDAGGNNVYDVIVRASDGSLNETQAIAVTITPVNDNVPVVTSDGGLATASITVIENTTSVTTVVGSDADLPAQTLSYAIVGGADAAQFTISTSTGSLIFIAAPVYGSPTDVGANNIYDVIVQVSDGTLNGSQAIAVTVVPVASIIVTPVSGLTTTEAGGTATFSIVLTTAPLSSVTINLSSSNTAEGTVSVSSVTFTSANWNVAQVVTVSGVADALVDGNIAYSIVTANAVSADAAYSGLVVADVSVTNLDNTGPSISSNGGLATASISVAENATAVTTVTATDADLPAQTLTYSIGGGADAAKFSINASTGVLVFTIAQNFESPTDMGGNNVYDVIVRVSDGYLTSQQAIAVTVTPVNEFAPVITSNGGLATASINVAENSTAVTTVTATDADLPGATLTYSISGGADAARFSINAATGVLVFAAAPNFESPTDAGGNNVYDVIVRASDGSLNETQAIAVTITPVNEFAPVITSNGGLATASVSVAENSTAVTTVAATDADLPAATLSFSINGGADAAKFVINSSTGFLGFASAPNFEAPSDVGANNVYDVIVLVSDGSLTKTQAIAVTVTPVNEFAPVITSNGGLATASINVAENSTAVATVTATDADLPAATLTYSISGGVDAARFTINASTGVLLFATAPNFESPTDVGTNNVYDVIVRVSDGTFTQSQTIAVTVTPVNEFAPVITSNGGLATASINVAENSTAVTTVTATDADLPAATLTYSISGGADAAKFTINAATGILVFATAPNFEAPSDVGTNNIYDVVVLVSDGTLTRTQAIAVTVTSVNEFAPVITSNGGLATASINVAENSTAVTTVTATDADLPSPTLTYSISGGPDAARFTINSSTGVLRFSSGRNFESPTDVGGNNVYDVIVRASDGSLTSTQAIAVTVTPVNEFAPVITSNGGLATASVNVAENSTAVTTVIATDADLPAATLTYSISGGADAAKFTINSSTGVLAFATAPNFEAPTDAGANNVYDVIVQASDGSLTKTQAIAVSITPVNEFTPVITSNGGLATASISVAENLTTVTTVTATDADLPAATLTYSITGGADAVKFTINSSTGVLVFATAPNFEAPTDAGTDNVYDVIVQVSDGLLLRTQAIAVMVTPSNEYAPVITSDGGLASASINVAENTAAVTTVTATDADLPAATLSFSITGGSDAVAFTINVVTGDLSFTIPPNFEAPSDSNSNNVYEVIVNASDGTNVSSQSLFISVTPVNEFAPVITSDGGSATAAINVVEGTIFVSSITGSDADMPAQSLTYTISGGVDASRFTINASTGALSFVTPPSFAVPVDMGADNVYDLTVQVSDGSFTDTQAISISVLPLGSVVVSPITGLTTSEAGANATFSVVLGKAPTSNVTISLLSSNTSEGTLSASSLTFTSLNWNVSQLVTISGQADAVADGNVAYSIITGAAVSADPTYSGIAVADVSVTNLDNTPPVIVTNGGLATAAISVSENTVTVTAVNANDSDVPVQSLTYSISGGADAARFTINAATGVLSFMAAPDFESPDDVGADNIYNVVVRASDAALSDTQSITVTVTPVNDNAPAIASNGGLATASISVAENTVSVTTVVGVDADLPAQTLVYSILGGADATKFVINSTTGALSFVSGRDYEMPSDADANNIYQVAVSVSDGTFQRSQAISVTVTPVNDNTPVITSNGGLASASVSVAENSVSVATVVAFDADLPTPTLTYSISGGADSSRFSINASTGVLAFTTAPDYESPSDVGGNNVYDVVVRASDGVLSTAQTFAVTVTPLNDNAPVIVSNGGLSSASIVTLENSLAVTTVVASDADFPAGLITYSISGGADASFFNINASTGVLRFNGAPDFELPLDAGANNLYDVIVQATDGLFMSLQSIAITIAPVNEFAPVLTSLGGVSNASISVAEGTMLVTNISATDADLPTATLVYSITGGADASRFSINSATGALSFVTPQDFLAPTDAGLNNVYDVSVQVSDGAFNGSQNIAVTIFPNSGIIVSPVSGLATSEAGTSAMFTVVLRAQPTADVVIALSVSNSNEASLSATALTFTNSNWNVAQVVTVTGVDDTVVDGTVAYSVVTSAAVSADVNYNGLAVSDISLNNTDNDIYNSITVDTSSDVQDGNTSSIAALLSNRGTDGLVSLREAILAANNTANAAQRDQILFNIADPLVDGLHAISITSVLPAITDAVEIRGSTEPGYAGLPVIAISGLSAGLGAYGLTINSLQASLIDSLVITGFQGDGLVLTGGSGHLVIGSYFGTDSIDSATSGNSGSGIVVNGASNVLIGGNGVFQANRIWNNAVAGIRITSGFANIVNNSFQANLGLNIDIGSLGVTPNDVGDNDSGANELLNSPVLIRAASNGSMVAIQASINQGLANTTMVMQAYSGSSPNIARYLGTFSVTTDAFGNASIVQSITASVAVGESFYLTASANGSTSEMSASQIVQAPQLRATLLGAATTSEAGASSSIEYRLNFPPTSTVTVTLNIDDGIEAEFANGTTTQILVFNSVNWATPQVVTVRGRDDTIVDGLTAYAVRVLSVISADSLYNGATVNAVSLNNIDNDIFNIIEVDTTSDVLDAAGGSTVTLSQLLRNRGADGRISLREAIFATNNTGNGSQNDQIRFNIASPLIGGVHTLVVGYALPTITDSVVIDGTTDPDYSGSPVVVIDGLSAGAGVSGLALSGPNSSVIGLGIQNFSSAGITLSGTSAWLTRNVLQDNSNGVVVSNSGSGNRIKDNQIEHNAGLMIDLGNDGITANDVGDVDSGANERLNSATLTSVSLDTPGILHITGTYSGLAVTNLAIDVYEHGTSALGSIDARYRYVGSFNVTTDALGKAQFIQDISGSYAVGTRFTATTTKLGASGDEPTSEHSMPVVAATSGIVITPVAGLVVNESGSTATFTVVLSTAPTADVSFTLAPNIAGEISLSTTAISFTSSNWNIAQSITISGLQDYVNDIDRLVTIVTSNLVSADTVYNGLSVSDVLVTNQVAPNQSPTISAPTGFNSFEDQVLAISRSGIVVGDPDAGSALLSVTLFLGNGQLTLGSTTGLSFTAGDGVLDRNLTFIGTIASINAAIDSLIITPDANFNGDLNFTISVNDLGNSGSGGAMTTTRSIATQFRAINDAPVFTGSATAQIDEGGSFVLTPAMLRLADIDNAPNELFYTLNTISSGGEFRLNRVAVRLGDTFTQADVTSGAVTYVHFGNEGAFESASLAMSDRLGIALAPVTFTINVNPVNDVPQITGFQGGTVIDSAPVGSVVATTSIVDPDNSSGARFSLLDNAAGAFAINAQTGVITVQDSSKINFQAAASMTVRVQVTDLLGASSDRALTIQVFNVPGFITPGTGGSGTSGNNNGGNTGTTGGVSPPSPSTPSAPTNVAPSFVSPPLVSVSNASGSSSAGLAASATGDGSSSPTSTAAASANKNTVVAKKSDIDLADEPQAASFGGRSETFKAGRRLLGAAELNTGESTEKVRSSAYNAFADKLLRGLSAGGFSSSQLPDVQLGEFNFPALNAVGNISVASFDSAGRYRTVEVVIDSAEVGGMMVSVGVMIWVTRTGGLLAALVSVFPVWNGVDPLIVLPQNRANSGAEFGDFSNTELRGDEDAVDAVLS